MKSEYFILIILCAILTSGPKIITLIFLKGKNIKREVVEFLNIIPFSSLAILITRSVLTMEKELILPSVISIGVCFLVSYFRKSIAQTIISGVVTMFVIIQIMGI
ncbi:AzlD domain-containing protein [Miniphocaeibacter massiliensis]|uniref:AzlD domain-containing protein n=1 Tax=Miniphocaeibacter massiliensis TaxID=2041841 RepID=UPI000C1BEA49|nr:AzlD domain-containing protein [Miniphocaeibacter massiliensis]